MHEWREAGLEEQFAVSEVVKALEVEPECKKDANDDHQAQPLKNSLSQASSGGGSLGEQVRNDIVDNSNSVGGLSLDSNGIPSVFMNLTFDDEPPVLSACMC